MRNRNREPECLRKGKEFHKKIQKKWLKSANGEVIPEKPITKLNKRKGRIDIFVKNGKALVAVAEIKGSDWNAMTPIAIRRNVRRYVRQIWEYIDTQLESGKEVSPGIIFQRRPKNSTRMDLIERLFEEEGIPVVWEDETLVERKARS